MEDRKIFTVYENELLLQLIEEKKDIIECKETNKICSVKKAEAFQEISKIFNADLNVTKRTAQQLRQRYLNAKKKATKYSAEIRREVRKTGGGESSKNIDHIDARILAMGVITQPLQTAYDSDSSFLDSVSSQATLPCTPTQMDDDIHQTPSTIQETIDLNVMPNVECEKPTPKKLMRRPLQLFQKRKKENPNLKASERAAEIMIQESKHRMELEQKKAEREEAEHKLKVELLQKQIYVQEKILHLLNTNPTSTISLNSQ